MAKGHSFHWQVVSDLNGRLCNMRRSPAARSRLMGSGEEGGEPAPPSRVRLRSGQLGPVSATLAATRMASTRVAPRNEIAGMSRGYARRHSTATTGPGTSANTHPRFTSSWFSRPHESAPVEGAPSAAPRLVWTTQAGPSPRFSARFQPSASAASRAGPAGTGAVRCAATQVPDERLLAAVLAAVRHRPWHRCRVRASPWTAQLATYTAVGGAVLVAGGSRSNGVHRSDPSRSASRAGGLARDTESDAPSPGRFAITPFRVRRRPRARATPARRASRADPPRTTRAPAHRACRRRSRT